MREAKVTCVCLEIRLKDLNLTLREGQKIWLTHERAQLSKDLAHAKRIGAVSITWKERARVTKPPPPPNFRRLSPGQRRQVQQPQAKPPPAQAPVVQQVDNDALAKHVKAAVAGEVAKHMTGIKESVAEQVSALREDLAAQVAQAMAAQGQPIDQDALTATLTAVIQANMPKTVTVQGTAPGQSGALEDDGPLYIPSGIVEDVKIQGEFSMTEGTADAGNTESAAKKLKKLKKSRTPPNE